MAAERRSNRSGGMTVTEMVSGCGGHELSRSLRSRHVTMIAIGGIGAGLFVGPPSPPSDRRSSSAISSPGS